MTHTETERERQRDRERERDRDGERESSGQVIPPSDDTFVKYDRDGERARVRARDFTVTSGIDDRIKIASATRILCMRVYACVSMRLSLRIYIHTGVFVCTCMHLRVSVCIALTRPWLKEGLFCSAEAQEPELLRSSRAEEDVEDNVLETREPGATMNPSLDHKLNNKQVITSATMLSLKQHGRK